MPLLVSSRIEIEQWNTDPRKCSQLDLLQRSKANNGAKIIFFSKMMLKQLGSHMQKINLDTDLLPFLQKLMQNRSQSKYKKCEN